MSGRPGFAAGPSKESDSYWGALVLFVFVWLGLWAGFWWYFLAPHSQPVREYTQDVRKGGWQIDLTGAAVGQTFVARQEKLNGVAVFPYDYALSLRSRGTVRFTLGKQGEAKPLARTEVQVTSVPVSPARYIFRFPTQALEKGAVYRVSLEGTGFSVWGNSRGIPGGAFLKPTLAEAPNRDSDYQGAASEETRRETAGAPGSLALTLYGPPTPAQLASGFLPWNASSYESLPRPSLMAWAVFAATLALAWLIVRVTRLPGVFGA